MDDSQLKLDNQICFPIYSTSRLITKAYKPFLDKMELLKRTRSTKDERIVVVQLTKKGEGLKSGARPIPEKLLTTLLTENIDLSDVVQLKELLNE